MAMLVITRGYHLLSSNFFGAPKALQTIMASWFAADFGARFMISEEGGKDFIQCPMGFSLVFGCFLGSEKVGETGDVPWIFHGFSMDFPWIFIFDFPY